LRAPRLLAIAVVTAVAGLCGGSALAEEMKIANTPMMAVTEIDVDAGAEAVVPSSGEATVPAREEPSVPKVVARIDLSDQTMTVYVEEKLAHVFKVSTGRRGYGTPTGQWAAQWLSPRHRSKKYHNAPMPWSVFFHGGYAVHGTTEVRRLGRPASHGCVRLLPANAKIFYKLVQANGKENTLVSVVR
jgi:lipoprotein-anchoring transpeptidase ErfK/SrfK